LPFPSGKANKFLINSFPLIQGSSDIKYKYLHISSQNQFKAFREIPKITKTCFITTSQLKANYQYPILPIENKDSYFENARLTSSSVGA